MIHTSLTKNFFGISLFGDFSDLEKLYNVIHHCADSYADKSAAKEHLHSFAYEIRHAKQGDRERKIFEFDNENKNTYYGAAFPLPYYLLSLNLMQTSVPQERKLWQSATILELVGDLQETALSSESLALLESTNYWVFNNLLNQPRLVPGQSIHAATREKDYLSITADFAVYKFIAIPPHNRLAKIGHVMNYMHAWTEEHKNALEELRDSGVLLEEGSNLEFEMLDFKKW